MTPGCPVECTNATLPCHAAMHVTASVAPACVAAHCLCDSTGPLRQPILNCSQRSHSSACSALCCRRVVLSARSDSPAVPEATIAAVAASERAGGSTHSLTVLCSRGRSGTVWYHCRYDVAVAAPKLGTLIDTYKARLS